MPITQTYEDFGGKPKWGLVPATITIGKTTWERSLLPFGDGTLFIALNEKVRSTGTVVYFYSEDCSELDRVEAAGGKVLMPKVPVEGFGFFGFFSDTEGNTVGFFSKN